MKGMFVALLLSVIALCFLAFAFRDERQRFARGFEALRQAFGPSFVMAVIAVSALLVAACWYEFGLGAAACASALILLAIRAHDLGEDEQAQNELDASYDALRSQRQGTRDVSDDDSRLQDGNYAHLQNRNSVALGPQGRHTLGTGFGW